MENVYYPITPHLSDSNSQKLLNLLIFFSVVLGSTSGHPAYDLRFLFNKISKKKICVQGLSRGDILQIDDREIEVIWPPKQISEGFDKSLCNRITKICEEIKKDDILNEIWKDVKKIELDENAPFANNLELDEINVDKINEETKKAVLSKIRKITNDLSLCLYVKDELLFLGDLENGTISKCLSLFMKDRNLKDINVKYFITPHHGTHYDDICENVKAEYVISSNGSNRSGDFKAKYNDIGKSHQTYYNGSFISFLYGSYLVTKNTNITKIILFQNIQKITMQDKLCVEIEDIEIGDTIEINYRHCNIDKNERVIVMSINENIHFCNFCDSKKNDKMQPCKIYIIKIMGGYIAFLLSQTN